MLAIALITKVAIVQKSIPKITIIARMTKIINEGNNTGKCNKSRIQSRERGFTNVAKMQKITIILRETGRGLLYFLVSSISST